MADLIKAADLKDRMKRSRNGNWRRNISSALSSLMICRRDRFRERCGRSAEDEEHHPDIDIRYNKVRLVLSTHSKGGLTELILSAERIDTLEE